MIAWSTDHLPRRDRFECWREERARRLFGVEIEIAPDWRPDFSGRIAAAAVGPATVIDLEVMPHILHRTQRAIDRAPDGTFAIWRVERGSGVMVAGGDEHPIGAGEISSGWCDLPYSSLPISKATITCRIVKIPLTAIQNLTAELHTLTARKHERVPGIEALLGSFLTAFLEQASHLSGAVAEQAVQSLVQLALAARGSGDVRDMPTAAAIRQGLLVRARRLVERDLHRAELGPAHVAAALGISVRKLHMMFEPTGESFSRHVTGRRLARADALLAAAPMMPVTEIAYACGFDSLSTFFRCYRAVYGASPGERRAALRHGISDSGGS